MEIKGNRNKNNYRIKIVVLLFAIFLLLILNIMLSKISKTKPNDTELNYDNLTNVRQVVEYYKCTYISEEQSKEDGFYLDVYLDFSKLPYDENDNSNEEFYNNIINDVAKVINYRNYKMIDIKNNITIKVTCKNRNVYNFLINDIEDYFIYMDSQISMKSFKEFKTIDLNITSELLQSVINDGWDNRYNFGIRDSIYEDYYIYFKQGIKVRTIQDKIYNIVFDNNYSGNVVNNLFPGISFDSIEASLGNPTFEDKDNNVIGYKSNDIYVFFSNNEISVYRNSNDNSDDFFKLADEFINEEIDLLEFMNKLTYLWPDYSKYEYSSDSVYLSYPLKGIEIKINYDDINGILVYNNIKSSMSKIQRYIENTNFVARLQLDAVFESEIKRINNNATEKERSDKYFESLDDEEKKKVGESLKYYYYPEIDNTKSVYKMKFVSQTGNEPNRELNDNISSYMWISNDMFIYSKKGKGIYSYNLVDGRVNRIIEGKDNFVLEKYENGKLYYDGNEIDI